MTDKTEQERYFIAPLIQHWTNAFECHSPFPIPPISFDKSVGIGFCAVFRTEEECRENYPNYEPMVVVGTRNTRATLSGK